MTLLIIYGVISIFFSFLCSILEAVLLCVTPTFINIKKKEGKAYAMALELLKRDVDKPLIAILTLNTIAHTVGAILVGVQAENVYGDGGNSIMIVSTLMTFLILVVSEIIPKTIGATYWKQLANFTSKALKILIFPLKYSGILWILQLATKLIGGKGHGSILSREGFLAMTDIAHEEGVFLESESKVIRNLLTFKEVLAKHIMTPRTVMKTASENMTIKEFFMTNTNLKFSRIPVYQNEINGITGMVLKDDVFKEMAFNHGDKKLSDIKRELPIVDRNIPIPELFEQLIEKKQHMAIVVDEYGTISGIVTQEDVIETLLGLEIMDESDSVADLQHLARKNWKIRSRSISGEDDNPQKE